MFEFYIDPPLENMVVVTDKIKLLNILKNLLDNAFKFTSAGKIRLSVTIQRDELVFAVEDTGIGIDLKYKEFIYKPFRQTETGLNRKYEGNGLGLTIAQKLVDILGGKIWFESEIGMGTVFHFSVPLKIAADQNLPELNNYEEILSGKKILIAEDDIANFLFFDAVLSNKGCKVVHAVNGKSAVEIFAHDPTFDIIIMDIKMPVMDGLEATYKIKAIRNDIPIVAYSAYVLNEEKQRALEAGCIDFLAKPAGKEQILKVIEKHIPTTDRLLTT
jgi:CheY-like chemotaxis protein